MFCLLISWGAAEVIFHVCMHGRKHQHHDVALNLYVELVQQWRPRVVQCVPGWQRPYLEIDITKDDDTLVLRLSDAKGREGAA